MTARETAVAEALADFIAEQRDAYPRVANDMDSGELAEAVLGFLAALDGLPATPDDGAVRALDEVERRIYELRNHHWQQHLRDHPLADAKSCPGDYGMHDAYEHSAGIVRAVRAALAADPADTGGPGE